MTHTDSIKVQKFNIKTLLVLLTLFATIPMFSQDMEAGQLWRTKGVYDSLGNFMERAKIQSFLYSASANKIHRLRTQDRINMETGDTKVFVYRDTLNLSPLGPNVYKLSEKEVLKLHSKDSLTITYNGFTLSYVLLHTKKIKNGFKKVQSNLLNTSFVETIDEDTKYQLTYQDSGLVKVNPLDSDSEWESDYKLIDFEGYILIQGIVSAPKLVTKSKKGHIQFIQIDYRFENKRGELNETTN
ncbi:MAG: hypothetical protein GYB32_05795 [Algicola sp.]|nr:hypothetical protein [Algicola sp.]